MDCRYRGFNTKLTHLGRPNNREEARFVNPPIVRGSSVIFPTVKDRIESWPNKRHDHELVYGICGTPTHFELEKVVCEIEGGTRCQLTSSGLSACTISLLAFCSAGDHILVPDSVYGPTRSFCNYILQRFGVQVSYYHASASHTDVDSLFQPNTKILYVESPGSHTFEVVDVKAMSAAAHRRGARVIIDNTWGIHFFNAFEKGDVDVSIQALTKYIGGHSDLLLGAIVVKKEDDWTLLRDTALGLGEVASPEDCYLALRGARTLGIRLEHQMRAGLQIAHYFESKKEEVLLVLHPALPNCPGHEYYKRDYTGCCSLFSVVFQPKFKIESVHAMLESYQIFSIAASWGGYESLVLMTSGTIQRTVEEPVLLKGPTVRYHIGLEDLEDLIADIDRGLRALREFS